MAFQNLTLDVKGSIATLTINRPKVLNALNRDTILELLEAVHQLLRNRELRGVIFTGAGEKSFIAGADISEFSALSPAAARELSSLGQRVTRGFENLPIPVVAAVNGFCLGGGFEFALCCDFILASENALLGLPEVSLGIIPGWGGTQRLARLIGPNRARQLVYSGAKLKAAEALAWGIVNAVYPQAELLAKTEELMAKIAANGPFAVAQAKRALNEGLQSDLDRGLQLEQVAFGLCFSTEDCREGAKAFQEKRPAQFTGK
jgi:enoyl-CoA hydratase